MIDICVPTLNQENPKTHRLYVTEMLESLHSTTKESYRLLMNSEKNSYAKAINNLLARTEDDEILLVNDDIIFTDGWLEKIRNGVGDVRGFKLLYAEEPNIIQHCGGNLRKDWCGVHIGSGAYDVGQFDYPYPVPFVTFAATYFKRDIYEKIGGLSEEYGRAYFEDVDWCLRCWDADFSVYYNPVSLLHHEGGTLLKEPKQKFNFMLAHNIFKQKWRPEDTIKMLRGKIR